MCRAAFETIVPSPTPEKILAAVAVKHIVAAVAEQDIACGALTGEPIILHAAGLGKQVIDEFEGGLLGEGEAGQKCGCAHGASHQFVTLHSLFVIDAQLSHEVAEGFPGSAALGIHFGECVDQFRECAEIGSLHVLVFRLDRCLIEFVILVGKKSVCRELYFPVVDIGVERLGVLGMHLFMVFTPAVEG